ncbi:MAG TPA: hypothetical protein ENG70_01295 [Candidatus Cloacimonetes bacterium]|nr:hypothetical protein [Candidatus Cloacimonadota bacterium]HEX37485.1 hypothetical protein [Candidatus Cloacimonadota bacterium]
MDADPMKSSSLGAGINLLKGTKTAVQLNPGIEDFKIMINDQISNAEISRWILRKFLEKFDSHDYSVQVSHSIEMPISAGFGTSGSGALSLVLALKDALDIDTPNEECYTLAHIADTENKGGLGTVMAEIAGGFEVRVDFGGPGVGKVESIPIDRDFQVIILYFGPFDTKKALSDKSLIDNILKYGQTCTDELLKDPSIERFLELSQWFVNKIEAASNNVKKIIKKMSKNGYICSMPLFGESVFSIQPKKRAAELSRLLQEYGTVIISDISTEGPHIC